MDLGNPIGQRNTVPSDGLNQGEHGTGSGLAGGHGHATSQNTQSGNSALGTSSGHAGSGAGGIPTGTPIADKFTHQGQGQNSVSGAYAGGATDDALTGQSNAHITGQGVGILGSNLPASRTSAASGGHLGSSGASNIPSGVSGAYAGSGASDALTGESHAQRTGAGVGPLGENLPQGHTATSAALAGTAGAAAAGAGAGAAYGTGVGASGGSGRHYSADQSTAGSGLSGLASTSGPTPTSTSGSAAGVSHGGLASGTGAAGSAPLDAQRAGAQAHAGGQDVKSKLGLGAGAGAGAGAAAVGAGAAASGAGSSSSSGVSSTDNSRGAPISDPKDLDHGGRHGLVFQESTGKYVHRHEVDEKK